jgi:hypothetical protein
MRSTSENNIQISPLIELSFKRLANLYDEEQGLFAFYIKNDKRIPMPVSWSICYTAITLLGLNKIECGESQEPMILNREKSLNSLVANWKRTDTFGHLGLIQWANAECKGQYSSKVTDAIAKKTSANYLKKLPTTELSWLLTGICATYQNQVMDDLLKELARQYYKALVKNFNPQTGLFRHTLTKVAPLDFRSHIGNFADQIYSVFALSLYYEIFNDKQAIMKAIQCADCLCSLQGKQGQWWWHYHSKRGSVGSPYPVFSVHQCGMGPMGLQKLSIVSGKDYRAPIYKGLNWLFGSNELGLKMVDLNRKLIWRDIELSPQASITRYISILLAETSLTRSTQQINSKNSLRLNREMRPYELGWLLYAFSGLLEK